MSSKFNKAGSVTLRAATHFAQALRMDFIPVLRARSGREPTIIKND